MKGIKQIDIIPGKLLKGNIKEYCKLHKLKFEGFTDSGFIASRKVEIRAGMEYTPNNGKIISVPIRKIGSKRVKTNFICYSDGDIVNGKALY